MLCARAGTKMRDGLSGRGRVRRGTARRAACALLIAAQIAPAGCATPADYSYARETRNERPYRGGAAAVPERRPPDPDAREPSALDLFAWLGVFAIAFTHGIDYVGTAHAPPPPPPPER